MAQFPFSQLPPGACNGPKNKLKLPRVIKHSQSQFNYPKRQWEKQTERQTDRNDWQTDWTEFFAKPRFAQLFFHSLPFVKNDKYAEIYFSNADGGCVT